MSLSEEDKDRKFVPGKFSDSVGPPRVHQAAIKNTDGEIFTLPRPGRHHDILRVMSFFHHKSVMEGQGFLLTTGEFVARREARQIAEAAGQLVPGARKHSLLFSEDVWGGSLDKNWVPPGG